MPIADQTPPDKYADAVMLTPYNDGDYEQEIIVTLGSNRESKSWKPKKGPLGQFMAKLCKHLEGNKDGPAFIPGDMAPGRRLKNAVKSIHSMVLDLDTGIPAETVDAAMVKLGCAAIRYTTHSHGKTKSEFKRDKIVKNYPDAEITTDLMRDFVRKVEHWDESIASTVEIQEEDHTAEGIIVRVTHAPMPSRARAGVHPSGVHRSG